MIDEPAGPPSTPGGGPASRRAPGSSRAPLPRRGGAALGFILRKLASTVALLVGVTLLTFILIQLVPGDGSSANLSETAQKDPKVVAAYRQKWGLDKSLPEQYFTYMKNLVRGDMGTSMSTGNSVLADLKKYVPATLELAIPAMLIAFVVAVVVGTWAAMRKDRPADHVARGASLVGLSTPSFWLAIVVLWVGYYYLDIAPSGGRLDVSLIPPKDVTGLLTVDALLAGNTAAFKNALWHLMLPVLVLSIVASSVLIRFVRSAVLEVLTQDYVTMARAKGLKRRVVLWHHIVRAAMVQIITVGGLAFASMLSGTVLIEQVFSWPGIGRYAYRAAGDLDLPAIIGVSLFVAIVYTIVNLIVDVVYGLIDPRIRAR